MSNYLYALQDQAGVINIYELPQLLSQDELRSIEQHVRQFKQGFVAVEAVKVDSFLALDDHLAELNGEYEDDPLTYDSSEDEDEEDDVALGV